MKFVCKKEDLIKGIQSVQIAINTKSGLPILSNILIDANDNNIVLTTTDLDIGITTTINIKPAITGSITVPAKKFFDIIKELPDGEDTTITVKKNNLVHIETGKNIFKIMGLPKDEFPQLPEFKDKDSITIPQGKLKKMLVMTNFAVSHDETRYVLNGILFVIKPSHLRLVATDGRRLAMVEEKMSLPKTLERKTIIPTKAVNELVKLLSDEGDIRISFGDNQMQFDTGRARLVSRLIDGDFPNYEQVIPKEHKESVAMSREKFLSAIKRVALFTNPESLAIKLDVSKDKTVLSKQSPSLGEAVVEIEADYKGKDMTVGFNPDYLIDVLKSISQDTVNFEIAHPEKPGVIRVGSEYTYVVLPMQIA